MVAGALRTRRCPCQAEFSNTASRSPSRSLKRVCEGGLGKPSSMLTDVDRSYSLIREFLASSMPRTMGKPSKACPEWGVVWKRFVSSWMRRGAPEPALHEMRA